MPFGTKPRPEPNPEGFDCKYRLFIHSVRFCPYTAEMIVMICWVRSDGKPSIYQLCVVNDHSVIPADALEMLMLMM